jgi:hypothetical protein
MAICISFAGDVRNVGQSLHGFWTQVHHRTFVSI